MTGPGDGEPLEICDQERSLMQAECEEVILGVQYKTHSSKEERRKGEGEGRRIDRQEVAFVEQLVGFHLMLSTTLNGVYYYLEFKEVKELTQDYLTR